MSHYQTTSLLHNKQKEKQKEPLIERSLALKIKKVTSCFKSWLISSRSSFERSPTLFSLAKLLVGLSIITLPVCLLYLLYFLNEINQNMNNVLIFSIFPLILTFGILIGVILILMITQVAGTCLRTGGMVPSWERIYLWKLLNNMVIYSGMLWLMMRIESFLVNVEKYKTLIVQSGDKECVIGSVLLRLLFYFLFTEGKHTDKKLVGTFYYDDEDLLNLYQEMCGLLSPIWIFCLIYLIKVILIDTKQGLCYGTMMALAIAECMVITYMPMKVEGNSYVMKYIEMILLALIVLNYFFVYSRRTIVPLIKGKLTSAQMPGNVFITTAITLTFLSTTFGISMMLFFIFHTLMIDFSPEVFEMKDLDNLNTLCSLGVLLIVIGGSYNYGNYIVSFVYYPIEYEFFPAILKNDNYKECSYNIVRQRSEIVRPLLAETKWKKKSKKKDNVLDVELTAK